MPTAHTGEFFELLRLGHATSVTLVCIVVNRLCLPTTSTRHPRAHPPVQWLSSRNIPTLPAHRSPPRLHPRFGSSRRCSRYYEVLRSEIRTHSHRLPGCCSSRLLIVLATRLPLQTLTPRRRAQDHPRSQKPRGGCRGLARRVPRSSPVALLSPSATCCALPTNFSAPHFPASPSLRRPLPLLAATTAPTV